MRPVDTVCDTCGTLMVGVHPFRKRCDECHRERDIIRCREKRRRERKENANKGRPFLPAGPTLPPHEIKGRPATFAPKTPAPGDPGTPEANAIVERCRYWAAVDLGTPSLAAMKAKQRRNNFYATAGGD